jgi:hypothetical protein
MATVIYTMFVSHRISTAHLEDESVFINRFQYEPFDLESAGFRLVLLEKGVQSQLRCQLWQAYLDDNDIIPYEALSYSWGSQRTPHEILVDGKTLLITESLYEALWHLRRPDEDRILWVDALCIDQNNIKERGHQVNRMSEIYGKADKVVVWLGYLSGNATKLKSAVTILEAKLAEIPGIPRKWPREDPRWRSQWEQVEASLVPSCRKELVDGLQSFMGKSWFSRVWILQEVANAKRAVVSCNLGEIPSWIFALLPRVMGVKVSQQCQAVLDIMPHPSKPSATRKDTRNLSNLLWKFRGCKATDPRDRVYALLGMATDIKGSAIQADYAKEEHVVMKDLYAYIVGGEWPVHDSPALNIQDFQQKLPDISRQKLQQMLESTFRTDLLQHFLCRQSLISTIDNDGYLFYVMQHGSSVMQSLLDKSTSLPEISLDVGLECLQRFPLVFEVLLQRPYCTFQDMPSLVVGAIERRPQLCNRLVESYSNPEQLRHDALLQAIPRGLPTCQALLDNSLSPIKISKMMLQIAINVHKDIVQVLLEEARAPIEILENVFLQATPGGFHILDESRKPIVITQEVIRKSIIAGPQALQVALVTMESTFELEEDLFITSIKNGLDTLKRVLAGCTKPFNVTKKVYRQAIKAGIEILSYLFPESFMALLNKKGTNFRVTERIREVAIEHSYAFEALGLRRHSEVFTESLNLDQCVLPGMRPPQPAQMNKVRPSKSKKRVVKRRSKIPSA